MITSSRKRWLNIFLNREQFSLIVSRFIKSNRILFPENPLKQSVKPKEKITVIRKKFNKNSETSIIEWKPASSVIKGLNAEYKYLYGPVQTSKNKPVGPTEPHDLTKTQLIQHESRIPIIEPSSDQNNHLCNAEQTVNLNSILTFPLVNKSVHPPDKVSELNSLRKHLETFCKDSKVPSVSLILQTTMPEGRKKILEQWKQNMIDQLGVEGFERYQSELFANGSSLHQSISSYLISTPEDELQIKEENLGHWKSLKSVFPCIHQVKLIEESIVHPFLCYKGVVDCFAKYKDHLVVIDWKASKKSKADIRDTYDNPLQIAAYVGALNFDPRYQYLASKGLIIIAYENGAPATPHFLDESAMEYYWNKWRQRVKQFWEMKIYETGAH